jgi:hypothetical protein
MKLSKYIPKLNESTKKRKHNYIGNCTDVDKQSNKRVCDLFPDATTMASVIGYDSMDETHENLTEISKNEFLQYVDETVIPKKKRYEARQSTSFWTWMIWELKCE